MEKLQVLLEEPYRELYLTHLNKTISLDPALFDGRMVKALIIKFGEDALDRQENQQGFSLAKLLKPEQTINTGTVGGNENHIMDGHTLLIMWFLLLAHIKLAQDSLDGAHLVFGQFSLFQIPIKYILTGVPPDMLKKLEANKSSEALEGRALESVDENVKHLGVVSHSISYI